MRTKAASAPKELPLKENAVARMPELGHHPKKLIEQFPHFREESIKTLLNASCAVALFAFGAMAQEVPQSVDQIAEPGGTLPGNPEVALVKVADGFFDPINVTNAGDGSGRIFVVERAGRVKIVNKDGSVNEEPFLDLTAINPLGSDVQTGFVEQGLYSLAFDPNFSENGYFYVHYASLPGVYPLDIR